ncbi:MAG TPA: hypothetical protein VF746_07635 [Longimicrobium sp.]|jgi:hypothetical protein
MSPTRQEDAGPAAVRASLGRRIERYVAHALERMSEADLLKAVAAQSPAETFAEIVLATPEPREHDWSELLLRGAAAKSEIMEAVGGLLSSSEAAALLKISVPGVKQRVQRRALLAAPMPGGQWGFPARQFDRDGRVREGVPAVAAAGAELDPWVLLSILADDVEDERGGILLERLDDADVREDVLSRLATYGEHVAP